MLYFVIELRIILVLGTFYLLGTMPIYQLRQHFTSILKIMIHFIMKMIRNQIRKLLDIKVGFFHSRSGKLLKFSLGNEFIVFQF